MQCLGGDRMKTTQEHMVGIIAMLSSGFILYILLCIATYGLAYVQEPNPYILGFEILMMMSWTSIGIHRVYSDFKELDSEWKI